MRSERVRNEREEWKRKRECETEEWERVRRERSERGKEKCVRSE